MLHDQEPVEIIIICNKDKEYLQIKAVPAVLLTPKSRKNIVKDEVTRTKMWKIKNKNRNNFIPFTGLKKLPVGNAKHPFFCVIIIHL